ncbi:MAG: CoA pyrophosphatase [Gammaproteobacteria bacterium]|nr:CoA pyrophosphatase [Gammaproteobacteria bacterium]MDH3465308.1 CoA pyrophosphatase [Gammaproteobacteria bacterium]
MIDLDTIRRRLGAHRPQLLDVRNRKQASVALVLRRQRDMLEMLFIERAQHGGDPWSGQMAFPGGRREIHDPDIRVAAERETLEELDLVLADAGALGRIDDLQGQSGGKPLGLVIACHAYILDRPVTLSPNYEVQDYLWVPLPTLLDPANQVMHPSPSHGGKPYPGIRVSDVPQHVVWGLTYRFVEAFFRAVGVSTGNPEIDGSTAGDPNPDSLE